MKEGFRQSMAWLHTWTGLIVAWVLFFVFVTGTAGYFNYEITRWMEPERPLAGTPLDYDRVALVENGLDRLQQVAPEAEVWAINLPHWAQAQRAWQDYSIEWTTLPQEGHERGMRGSEQLDPATGGLRTDIEPRATGGGRQLYIMHYALHYIDYPLAFRLVGICTMLMLVAIITGVITHKKIFKDFFTFRPGKGQRSWLDAHNVISVMALPFFLMITYSGLMFFAQDYMPAPVASTYGTDRAAMQRFYDELYDDHGHLAVERPQASIADMMEQAMRTWGPDTELRAVLVQHDRGEPPRVEIGRAYGDAVRWRDNHGLAFHANTGEPLPAEPADSATIQSVQVMYALHEGRFAEPWLRWLYFIAGLLGCGMIGTGMVLWTVKRRKQHAAAGTHFGHRLVEALNVATIAGLPAGVAAYFWANRLLPVELAERANWEVNFLFLIWGETLIYALFRDIRKAWVELLWLGGAAYALLPLVNALTTDRHLGVTLPAGDWTLAGFDLTMLALGAAFGYMAVKVKRRWLAKMTDGAPTGHSTLAGGTR